MFECLIIAFASACWKVVGCWFSSACRKVPVCAISKLMLITARTEEMRVVDPSSVALLRTE